jgi:hypothetical protein
MKSWFSSHAGCSPVTIGTCNFKFLVNDFSMGQVEISSTKKCWKHSDKPTNMHTIHNGVLYWLNVTSTYFGGQATVVRGCHMLRLPYASKLCAISYVTKVLRFLFMYISPHSTIDTTMELTAPCYKSRPMNCLENFYIHLYHTKGTLIIEQYTGEPNPLLAFAVKQT